MSTAYIFGDSRLKYMQEYINSLDTGDTRVRIISLSGKGIFVVTTEVMHTLKYQPNAKVIITAGICDFTFRNNTFEKYRFTFHDSDDLATHLLDLIEDSHKKILAAWPEARVSYSELIGLDLTGRD